MAKLLCKITIFICDDTDEDTDCLSIQTKCDRHFIIKRTTFDNTTGLSTGLYVVYLELDDYNLEDNCFNFSYWGNKLKLDFTDQMNSHDYEAEMSFKLCHKYVDGNKEFFLERT